MEDKSKTFVHEGGAQLPTEQQAVPSLKRKFSFTNEILDDLLFGKKVVKLVDIGLEGNEKKVRKNDKEENFNGETMLKSIWCEECCRHIQGTCGLHNLKPERTYAVTSFPPEVKLCTSSIPGCKYGACAGKKIPRGTWIGPYEGKRVYTNDQGQFENNGYIWEIYKNGQFSHFLDGSDETKSSWMRFIRCARHKKEQNMAAFQYGDNIYYRALKDIDTGNEILVWYDQTYTQFLGIPFEVNQEVKVGPKGVPKDSAPSVAQHFGLSNVVNGSPMVSANTTSPRFTVQHKPPRQPIVPPHSTNKPPPPRMSQLGGISAHATKQRLPVPSPFTQPVMTHPTETYHGVRPIHASAPFYPPSTISLPYQVPTQPQLPHGMPLPQPSTRFDATRTSPTTHIPRTPPAYLNTPLGSYTKQIGVGKLPVKPPSNPPSPTTSYPWSPTEIKENMPAGSARHNSTEFHAKITNSSQPMKSSPLQNLTSSVNSSSPVSQPFSEPKDQNQVSSTVETKTDEEDSWKCRQCEKTFSQRLTLQMHVCSRAPEKPFQCGRCPLSFANPSELRDHVITHNNDRPFKCGFCGRSFAGATTLNNHMRMHTGEKPFTCEKCGRTFAIGTQLSRHLKQPGECHAVKKDHQWNHPTTAIAVE